MELFHAVIMNGSRLNKVEEILSFGRGRCVRDDRMEVCHRSSPQDVFAWRPCVASSADTDFFTK